MKLLGLEDMVKLGFPRQPAMQPALSPVVMSFEDFDALVFVHHVTTVGPDEGLGRFYGTTVWVAPTKCGQCAALGFDWQEITEGVLSVVDPFGITSNFYPATAPGDTVNKQARLRALVMAVHKANWHERVREHLPKEPESKRA